MISTSRLLAGGACALAFALFAAGVRAEGEGKTAKIQQQQRLQAGDAVTVAIWRTSENAKPEGFVITPARSMPGQGQEQDRPGQERPETGRQPESRPGAQTRIIARMPQSKEQLKQFGVALLPVVTGGNVSHYEVLTLQGEHFEKVAAKASAGGRHDAKPESGEREETARTPSGTQAGTRTVNLADVMPKRVEAAMAVTVRPVWTGMREGRKDLEGFEVLAISARDLEGQPGGVTPARREEGREPGEEEQETGAEVTYQRAKIDLPMDKQENAVHGVLLIPNFESMSETQTELKGFSVCLVHMNENELRQGSQPERPGQDTEKESGTERDEGDYGDR